MELAETVISGAGYLIRKAALRSGKPIRGAIDSAVAVFEELNPY
jgi:hypothetical protein